MMHRFEGIEGSFAVVLDSVEGTLFVDLKYIKNYISTYHFRTILKIKFDIGSKVTYRGS